MNSSDFQILRFEIEGLGKRFAACIIPRADELDAGIRKAFTDLTKNGRLQQIIEAAAQEAVADAIKAVMQNWEVRDAMKKKCLVALGIKDKT